MHTEEYCTNNSLKKKVKARVLMLFGLRGYSVCCRAVNSAGPLTCENEGVHVLHGLVS